METTELLLRRGADFTATDKKCFTPILACAKDDNVALCLASMLVEYFKNSDGSAEGSNRASVGIIDEKIYDPVESTDIACKRYGSRYSCQNSIYRLTDCTHVREEAREGGRRGVCSHRSSMPFPFLIS